MHAIIKTLCFIVALGVFFQLKNFQGFAAYGDEACLDGHAQEHSSTESTDTHQKHHANCQECTSHTRTGLVLSLFSVSTIYPIQPRVSYVSTTAVQASTSGFLGIIFRPPIA